MNGVKRTKKLKKVLDPSSKTRFEIKNISRDLDLLVNGFSRRYNYYQNEQTGVIEHKEKKNVINITKTNSVLIGIQVNCDNIELVRLKE